MKRRWLSPPAALAIVSEAANGRQAKPFAAHRFLLWSFLSMLDMAGFELVRGIRSALTSLKVLLDRR
jgi:hypothetical protein